MAPLKTKLALAAFMLTAALPLLAQSGELRLEVRDPSGAGMQARGRLRGQAIDRRFESDSQGNAVLGQLAAGRYRLDLAKEGFAPQSILIDVESSAISRSVTMALSNAAFSVNVVSGTPLGGSDLMLEETPAPVQTLAAADLESSGALALSDLMNRRLNGVYLNEVQGNPVQPDLNYRGYTASPLLGTPQGVSIYMDGVRMNQPFGDVVSWDLLPRNSVETVTLIPGSNPLFGLNTLGGALSLETKDGRSAPGTLLDLSGGSFGRKMGALEHGGSNSKGFSWYGAANLFFEDGWRAQSPSNVRQFFGKVGWQGSRTSVFLAASYANNSLNGNGLQDQRLLDRDYNSAYTLYDQTRNRSPFTNLRIQHAASAELTFSGNIYYRYIRTRTFNGDINEDSLDQSVYQPGAAEQAALTAAGYRGFPTSGANAANTPFPFWRCIGNVLLRDEPGEKCNGLLNRGNAQQRNYGASGQLTWSHSFSGLRNQFTAGAAYDRSNTDFSQLSELGYLNPDRTVTGTGAFADGVTGGDVDGEPFDTRVNLDGRIRTGSVFATNTATVSNRWHFTGSLRFNHTNIENRDRIRPAGPGSLTGNHSFDRVNPAVGLTFDASENLNLYFSYSEGSRAPSPIELGCADPQVPCKLPNAMAGDPPLNQVLTRTLEAGLRGTLPHNLRWSAGWFRGMTRDDILFVASPQTGFGYFKNFGKTLRQGLEANISLRAGRVSAGAGYTLLNAEFRSPEEVNGSSNSTNEDALRGVRGVESTIEIAPGDRIPLVPRHLAKIFADVQVTSKFTLDAGVMASSGMLARGNENNLHQPDGVVYLGAGATNPYAVVNLGARYQLNSKLQFYVTVNNLFNRKYATAAQLSPTGFTDSLTYIARPLPAVNGEFPVRQSTFVAPGAPIGAWGGIRLRF